MAGQTGTSPILSRLGKRAGEVLANHAAKEPELPNMGLPAGIDNGVAQVVECKFGVVEAGKPKAGATYFMGQGIVKEPQQFKGVTIAGRRTMIYKEVADAKGVINEKNMEWAQDQLKILVGKGADPGMFLLDTMENTAALIRKAKPHTLFRTFVFDKQDVKLLDEETAKEFKAKPGWYLCNLDTDGNVKGPAKGADGKWRGPYANQQAGKAANRYAGREPMVNQQWCGTTQYIQPSANGQAGVVDESPPADEPDTSSLPTGHGDDTDTSGEAFNEFQEPAPNADDIDLDALAAEALTSAEAQNQLNEIAVNVGVDADAVSNADSWTEVVAMIRAAGGTDAQKAEEPPAEEPWTPAKGEVCYYGPKLNGKPVLGKNKKPLRVEVVILTSDKKSSTSTIQDNATKKPILGTNKKPLTVSWDDLSAE